MRIAPEGRRELIIGTVVLAGLGALAVWLWWPAVLVPVVLWGWLVSFFRDPVRVPTCAPGELCAPADGTVTEITELPSHDTIAGPAVRVGIFLSLFNVHANRAPCTGVVRSVTHKPGQFLDARHPESGQRNEAVTIVFDPQSPPVPGPVVVRQVAGLVARRIVCHLTPGASAVLGERFGMIKFGSRTELIIPRCEGTEVLVQVGTKVRAGVTVMARQAVPQ